MSIKNIETPVGVLMGRDAIFFDKLLQHYSPSAVTFLGDFNGSLCSQNDRQLDWIPCKVSFIHVIAYECQSIDSCSWEKLTQSSFDEAPENFFVNGATYGDDYRYFYFSTYDYVFKIVAKQYKVEILEKHKKL
ncbi:MAG: hypothetical protein KTR20_10020 [Cellvibrionaceae bacterium]|nr:hypothetical protein [Cellvibrionaceae bacterium]